MLTMQGGDSLVGGLPIIHITYQQYIANPSAYQDPDVIVHISGFPTAGNMPADYVGYDSTLNMEDIGNIATKAIAKVEPSDTALYLHEVGTGFINKDGNYCITDVQISVGGTITLGTNCHVVDGGISSNLAVATDTINGLTIKKCGKLVQLHSYGVTKQTLTGMTLPEKYRTALGTQFIVYRLVSNKQYASILSIPQNGTFNVTPIEGDPAVSGTDALYFTVMYYTS